MQTAVWLLGEPMNIVKPLYFVTGRLYVPLYETISAMGEGVSEDDDSYTVSRQELSAGL